MRLFSKLWLAAILSGCVTSVERDVDINKAAAEDKDYFGIYKTHTQEYEVIKNFETRHVLSVTYLSSEFRQAFATRFRNLYNESQDVFDEPDSKTGFFVTVYSENKDLRELGDERLWNIQLLTPEGERKPSMVRSLTPKERWRPFFPNVSPWTKEFLVLFDGQVSVSPKLVEKSDVKLVFSNPNAKVTFQL